MDYNTYLMRRRVRWVIVLSAVAVLISMLLIDKASADAVGRPGCEYQTIGSPDGVGGNTEAVTMELSYNEQTGEQYVFVSTWPGVWLNTVTVETENGTTVESLPMGSTRFEYTIPGGVIWSYVEACGQDASQVDPYGDPVLMEHAMVYCRELAQPAPHGGVLYLRAIAWQHQRNIMNWGSALEGHPLELANFWEIFPAQCHYLG